MLTRDIHYKCSVSDAIYNLDVSIKLARSSKEKVLCLIVGYGSSGGSHKIKTAVISELEDKVLKKQIKDFIKGEDLDLFSSRYLNFKYRELIPSSEKKEKNKGKIYLIL